MIHLLLLTLAPATTPIAALAAPQEGAPAGGPESSRAEPTEPVSAAPVSTGAIAGPQALLYVEVPDLPTLLEAYERAPVIQMIRDEAVRSSVGALLDSTGVEVAPAVAQALQGLGLPPGVAEAPLAAARQMLDQVRSASLSISLTGDGDALGQSISKTLEALMALEDLKQQVGKFTEANQGFPPGSLEELELSAERLLDPWGNPWELEVDLATLEPELRCLGADGRAGGEGFDADLSSAEPAPVVAARLIEQSVQVGIDLEFVDPEAAGLARDMALDQIERLGLSAEVEREVELAGSSVRVRMLREQTGEQVGEQGSSTKQGRAASGAWPELWLLEQGSRLRLGYGAGSLEHTLATGGKLRRPPMTPEEAGGQESLSLGSFMDAPSGATVVHGWTRLAPLDDLLVRVESALEAHEGINVERLPIAMQGAFRMRLDGERFVTELASLCPEPGQQRSTTDADLLRCVGGRPLPGTLWDFVPAEAIGVLALSLDGAALYEEILKELGASPGERPKVLAELEQRHGFSLDEDLIANIGDGAAAYLLPITGVISIPGVALAIELRDAQRFQDGLDGLLRLLEEQAGGEFSVRYKPYRDQPLWTFAFGGPGSGGMGLAGPLSVSPSLAIVDGHLIVTLTSLRAKKEIKRLLAGEGEPHRLLAGEAAPPPAATMVAFMDWPAFLEGTYEGARAALALFGGMSEDLPFDPEVLPAAETFTRFFRPTLAWSHRPDPRVSITRIESSFGPETWLGVLSGSGALALGVSRSVESYSGGPGDWEEEELVQEDPERAAAIERTELTLAEVATRLEVFRIEAGRYPRSLAELLEPTDNFPRGYLERDSVPLDGWERDLKYLPSSDGGAYELWSVGENGMDERGNGDDVRVP